MQSLMQPPVQPLVQLLEQRQPRINLLPWRAQARQRHKRNFLCMLLSAAALAGLISLLQHSLLSSRLRAYTQDNQTLQAEMTEVDAHLAEMHSLQQQVVDLRAQGAVISGLQAMRPLTVHILDSFVQTLPQGITYRQIARSGNSFSIQGEAESYAHITELMRRLDDSPWLHEAVLNNVSVTAAGANSGAGSGDIYDFSLSLMQTTGDSHDQNP